jgi:hypothetical protein
MATSKSDGSSRLDGILFAEDFGDDETQDAASLAGDHTADQTPSTSNHIFLPMRSPLHERKALMPGD